MAVQGSNRLIQTGESHVCPLDSHHNFKRSSFVIGLFGSEGVQWRTKMAASIMNANDGTVTESSQFRCTNPAALLDAGLGSVRYFPVNNEEPACPN